ncbi:hypothetical protein AKJ09_08581 [Labilithrix luteola]|uniref:Cytochrome c domain-containing protein n=1 Tax=Labilithrix luteola TaxID=1391654 RepID=A0A0K1Q851_9BACT|nr:hypothetical protein [Labilithrix luteola]AKV01918.1 hypothetical protein AKJ09_08581 [Labilithrix luteola]
MVASHVRKLASRSALLFATSLLTIVVSVACSSSDKDSQTPSRETAGQDPEPLFRAVQDELVRTCGGANGSCHVAGTTAPHWLGGDDPYVTAKNYKGILPATREVGDSILLTQIDHEGPSLKRTPSLFEGVASWLQAEVPPPPLPNTGAFTVASGFNSIPLDTVASGMAGGRITFLATENNGTLTLSALRFYAPPKSTVKMEAPFFVILPRSGKVDADPKENGFTGELTVNAGTSADFFSGKMILLHWDATGQLKIAFQKLETTEAQGAATGCTALDVFQSKALNAMRADVEEIVVYHNGEEDGGPPAGTVVGKNSCLGCHAGAASNAPPEAVQAMDLRAADTDPATACAQARNWINFQDKTQSTILLNPTGKANPNHPMRALSSDDPIVQGLNAWVQAETQ